MTIIHILADTLDVGPNIALVLTAAGTLLTAGAAGFVAIYREIRANRRDTREVHQIVNGKDTALRAHQATLADLLRSNGIDVPPDPSLQTPADPTGAP